MPVDVTDCTSHTPPMVTVELRIFTRQHDSGTTVLDQTAAAHIATADLHSANLSVRDKMKSKRSERTEVERVRVLENGCTKAR